MVTTKSRTGKSTTKQVKSRTARLRTAPQPHPAAKPAAVVQDAAPDLVVAGVSAMAGGGQEQPAATAQSNDEDETDTTAPFKKKQLVERVQSLSGAKKRDVRDIVEATLTAIGEALGTGKMLVLPPLGKLTVNRQKDLPSGEVMIVKIRRPGAGGNAGKKAIIDPLADDGEDG